jgi:ankyrin repeat protein
VRVTAAGCHRPKRFATFFSTQNFAGAKSKLVMSNSCITQFFHRVGIVLLMLAWSRIAFCGEIHDAIRRGDLQRVQALLKDNSNLIFERDTNDFGATPLQIAVVARHTDIIKLLLAQKADPNETNNHGETSLHSAADLGKKDIIELLLANNANIEAKNNDGWTPLEVAAFSSRLEAAKILLANKANVNAKDHAGGTPLFRAVLEDDKEMVKLLRVRLNNLFFDWA